MNISFRTTLMSLGLKWDWLWYNHELFSNTLIHCRNWLDESFTRLYLQIVRQRKRVLTWIPTLQQGENVCYAYEIPPHSSQSVFACVRSTCFKKMSWWRFWSSLDDLIRQRLFLNKERPIPTWQISERSFSLHKRAQISERSFSLHKREENHTRQR